MTDAAEYLRDAIDRNAPAAFTILTGGLSRLCRSRLLAADDGSPDRPGLWAAMPSGQTDAIDAMIQSATPCRVTFKRHDQNVEFSAAVLERRRAFKLNAEVTVEAVRLAWPATVTVVQRRSAYRVAVLNQEDVTLKFWRIPASVDLAAAPPEGSELMIDVRDFSNAGVGGIWKRRRGEDPVLPSDQRLRVDITTPGTAVTLEAYARFMAALPEPEYRRIGVQFMLRPASLVDRAKLCVLNKITGDLQRAELKRLRVAR